MFARSFAFRACSQQCSRTSPRPGIQFISNPTWRYFSSSIPRTKAVKPPVAPRASPKSQPRKVDPDAETLKFAGRRPEGFGKFERKVAKEGTLVLYKAPSHRSYILCAYGVGAFCFAYCVYNSEIVFRSPVFPLPTWQKALFGGICVMMSVMGTVFIAKTSKLIRTITATNIDDKTYLNFKVRRMIPFMKPMEIRVLPRQVAFSRRLVVTPESMDPANVSQQKQPEKVSFFKVPIRMFSMALWRLFRSVRQVFTQEDFVLLELDGHKGSFRMDSTGYISQDFLNIGDPRIVVRGPRR